MLSTKFVFVTLFVKFLLSDLDSDPFVLESPMRLGQTFISMTFSRDRGSFNTDIQR